MNEDVNRSIWQGRKVRLRAVEPGDWNVYHAWNFDDEQTRNLNVIPFPQSAESVRRWVEQESLRRPEKDDFRFVIENDAGEVVGDLTTQHCDPRIGTLSYGVNIRAGYRRRGYASEAILLVLRYYFRERRYQKVTVQIRSYNEPSILLHRKLGFQEEGRLRRVVYTDGRHFDELYFGLTVEEFDSLFTDNLVPVMCE